LREIQTFTGVFNQVSEDKIYDYTGVKIMEISTRPGVTFEVKNTSNVFPHF
jgi:hypothetical protein